MDTATRDWLNGYYSISARSPSTTADNKSDDSDDDDEDDYCDEILKKGSPSRNILLSPQLLSKNTLYEVL